MTINELIEMKKSLSQRVSETQNAYAENLECLENYIYRCSATGNNWELGKETRYFKAVEKARECFLTAVKDYEDFMNCEIITMQAENLEES